MPQDRLGVPVQHASGFGKLNALGTTGDQLPPQFRFKTGKMMADRGLRHMQLICGARQAARLNNPDEVAELTQVHDLQSLIGETRRKATIPITSSRAAALSIPL